MKRLVKKADALSDIQNLQNDVNTFLTTFQQVQQQVDTLEQSATNIQTELTNIITEMQQAQTNPPA
jgi:type VII secretion effector (TIGR04197 family)